MRVGSSTSEWLLLKKGVPKGSVLGPVLFNIFVNYLYAAINTCDLYNYAHDNTISASCDSKQYFIYTLLTESTTAMKLFEANMIQANPGKFQAIILKEPSDSRTMLTVDSTIITTGDSVKLLGVHLDRLLDVSKQIQELCPRLHVNSTYYSASRYSSTETDEWTSSGLSSCPTPTISPGVELMWCYRHQATRTHTIPCTEMCDP